MITFFGISGEIGYIVGFIGIFGTITILFVKGYKHNKRK